MTLPVFLVEDDPAIREQLKEVIAGVCEGDVIATAGTESDAVNWLRSHPNEWALTVLDLYLAEGTGIGVLQQMPPEVRKGVIVLTNSATPENRQRCIELGVRAVYDKTAELEKFLDHCHQIKQG